VGARFAEKRLAGSLPNVISHVLKGEAGVTIWENLQSLGGLGAIGMDFGVAINNDGGIVNHIQGLL